MLHTRRQFWPPFSNVTNGENIPSATLFGRIGQNFSGRCAHIYPSIVKVEMLRTRISAHGGNDGIVNIFGHLVCCCVLRSDEIFREIVRVRDIDNFLDLCWNPASQQLDLFELHNMNLILRKISHVSNFTS